MQPHEIMHDLMLFVLVQEEMPVLAKYGHKGDYLLNKYLTTKG